MSRSSLWFVTGNQGKLKEVQAILKDAKVQLKSRAIDVPEIQGSIEEIVKEKCRRAYEVLREDLGENDLVLVDDTSLSFDGMNGHPGPYIKDMIRKMELRDIWRLLSPVSLRATALATFAVYNGSDEPIIVQGECRGTIVEPRGLSGFGWDPMFEPDGQKETFAEMDEYLKNKISHRADALTKLEMVLVRIN